MYLDDGRLVLSPSDFVGFLYCGHLTELSLATVRGSLAKPPDDDPDLQVVQRRGLEHEGRYLTRLEGERKVVVQIDTTLTFAEQVQETLDRLCSGPPVIYQAAFLDLTAGGPYWRGHADFLRRVDRPSHLGNFSYEPEDTKLARHVRPSAVIQLCNYAGHLERIQGIAPESIHVILGGDRVESLRLMDFAAYYRATKARFEQAIANDVRGYPDPVGHCAVCSWREACDQRRIADDHLSIVANIRAEQIRKLHDAGITTVSELAQATGPVRGMASTTFEKLHHQARLQVAARSNPEDPPPFEVLPDPGPDRGLSALPKPSSGDLFFDIEGDPFVGESGLEYLLGVGWAEPDGSFGYRAFWGHNDAEEKQAFEEFIDFVVDRLHDQPDLHVYHYAPYEPTALGRLMGRHATREEEVDGLLRAGTLIDLLRVVRQGVRVGTPSYGLKKLEGLYMAARTGVITDAGSSIVEYERWLEDGDGGILRDLESYNKDDCESTMHLRDWLEARRLDYTEEFGSTPGRPQPGDADASERVAVEASENAVLMDQLLQRATRQPGPEKEEFNASWLLAQLLDWHRREEKPEWWQFYHRALRCDEEDLFADTEAVAGLDYEGETDRVDRSAIHRYRFDPTQDHKLKEGQSWRDPASEQELKTSGTKVPAPGTIVSVDPVEGIVDLKRGVNSTAPHPRCLVPPGPIPTDPQKGALRRVAASTVAGGIDGAGPYRAVRDLLLHHSPRLFDGPSQGSLRRKDESPDDAVLRLALALDGGTLAVQGPPGSGKTRTAARTIVALTVAGRRVGITANSHAVITNLLADIIECAERTGAEVRISQKSDDGGGLTHPWVTQRTSNDQMAADLATANILAGTAWLFCRPEFDQSLDYMVVDEAGQLSLANVVAAGTAARNLVMVGDPNQLAQPSKGTHPPGVDVSGLSHLLGDAATMPADLGLFLDHTHRLHPEICRYISEVFYDDRLASLPGCERQTIGGEGPLAGSGLRWCPVEHSGNRTASQEEAEAVRELIIGLEGRAWTDRAGGGHMLNLDDILVVAPYNAQVSLLGHLLPAGVEVGTVDKFQGRQAPVVIVSMAASAAEDVPRGMEFLYSRNRLNVAISRAKALSIVVASPALLSAQCRTVEQMRLVNGLCRFVELASPVTM